MAYRLTLDLGNTTLRAPLIERETVIGSSSESGIRVPHFAVSRRHAVIRIRDDDTLEIEDLGSRNGTTVEGKRVSSGVALEAGARIVLAGLPGTIERVDSADLEAAVEIPSQDLSLGGGNVTPPSERPTVSLNSLKAIALRHLPALLQQVSDGVDSSIVAQGVGAALFNEVPCRSVEITSGPASRQRILFSAGEIEGSAESQMVVPTSLTSTFLRVAFVDPAHERAYAPLVDALALLIGLEGPRSRPRLHRKPLPVSSQPDPPSVVPEVKRIYEDAARVAPSEISILIQGESGTGKEVLARFIHRAANRRGEFVALNCAALPQDLLEAELFGIERGVATGVDARPGKFELADGGTLFLDEIGDMAPATQAKILRVLQEREVYRLGSATPRPARVRVVSATNTEIDRRVDEGTFRADLYHRIADWVVQLPPLRDRRADIPSLAVYFLTRSCRDRGIHPVGLSRAAIDALEAYDWPGNIRQLEREMARAALFIEDGELLDTSRLQPSIVGGGERQPRKALGEILAATESRELRKALDACGGDAAEAAKRLDLSRSTFYRRLKALGISLS